MRVLRVAKESLRDATSWETDFEPTKGNARAVPTPHSAFEKRRGKQAELRRQGA
jgi:hypothetical protein